MHTAILSQPHVGNVYTMTEALDYSKAERRRDGVAETSRHQRLGISDSAATSSLWITIGDVTIMIRVETSVLFAPTAHLESVQLRTTEKSEVLTTCPLGRQQLSDSLLF